MKWLSSWEAALGHPANTVAPKSYCLRNQINCPCSYGGIKLVGVNWEQLNWGQLVETGPGDS